MTETQSWGPEPFVALRAAEQAFWQAAATAPIGTPLGAFPPGLGLDAWLDENGFWAKLARSPEQAGGEGGAVAAAAARYAGLVAQTWQRIAEAFDAHRLAISDPSPGAPPPDWQVLRDRWFDIAEAEFIALHRETRFLSAQRDAIRAVIDWRAEIPAAAEAQITTATETVREGQQLLRALGLEGVDIATTPAETVWQADKMRLLRFLPLAGRAPSQGPLLISYGLIGRQTMTDLRPDRSLVRHLLAGGVDVFTIDWGNAGPEDAANDFGHYAQDRLGAAIAEVRRITGQRPVLFGICQGGVFATCHAALNRDALAGLILAVTPIDFHADVHDADPTHGILNLWIRSLTDEDIRDLIALEDRVPGDVLGLAFGQLNPIRTLAKYTTEFLEIADDPAARTTFLAMERWLADRPDLPGALAHAWLSDLYLKNRLVSGEFCVLGQPVTLGNINLPVLNIYASGDHIIPPPCSRALGHHLPPERYRELSLPTGHIGVFVSAKSQTRLAPAILGWLAETKAYSSG